MICIRRSAVTTTWMCRRCPSRFRWGRSSRSASRTFPANKNLGVTHITNGCYRLHPAEWNIGESAGELACYCLEKNVPPRGVLRDGGRLREFQDGLTRQGGELEWPAGLKMEEGEPHRHAM